MDSVRGFKNGLAVSEEMIAENRKKIAQERKMREEDIAFQQRCEARKEARKQAQIAAKKQRMRIAVCAAAAVVAVGGWGAYKHHQEEVRNTATDFKEAFIGDSRKAIERYGIDIDIYMEIIEKERKMNAYKAGEITLEELTEGDMKNFVEEYAKLGENIAKIKLAQATEQKPENIIFKYAKGLEGEILVASNGYGALKIPRDVANTYESSQKLRELYELYEKGNLKGNKVAEAAKTTFNNTVDLTTIVYEQRER